MLKQVKRELQHPDPLPARLREQWSAAAKPDNQIEPALPPQTRSSRFWYLAAALAASLLLALIPLSGWWTGGAPPIAENVGNSQPNDLDIVATSQDRVTVGQITVSTVDGRAQLDELDSSVAKLQTELLQLVERSEQLAAQQELSQLLASHQRWQSTGM
jgi:hypothetical protein